MTTKEVEALLEQHGKTWPDFMAFMDGQTIGGTPNEPNWYEDDVHRFINNQKVID